MAMEDELEIQCAAFTCAALGAAAIGQFSSQKIIEAGMKRAFGAEALPSSQTWQSHKR
jgi:hypothetical protein